MISEFSCGAILFRREGGRVRYLLLDYRTHWDFPKGQREKGESGEETVRREVLEETGIAGLELKGFKRKLRWMYKKDGKLVSKEAVYYLAETREKEVKVSWEHAGYRWCSFEEALALVIFKNAKEMLVEADAFLEEKGWV